MQYSAAHSRLALMALVVLSAARLARADQVVNLLPNGGAERVDSASGEPADWSMASQPAKGLRMWRDTDERRRGEASFAIANEHEYEELVANNWVHELRFVPRGRVIRMRGYVRTKDAEAANICMQCWGADGEQLVGFASTPVLRGTKEWVRVESDRIVVPKETTKLVVRAALVGKGSAWFDNMKLEVVGPPVVSDPSLTSAVPGRIVRRLPVEKDAMILAYMPEWNHGNVDNIAVASNDGGVRTLVAWRKPAAADVANEKHRFLLAMYCREVRGEAETFKLQVHVVTKEWPELVSWDRRPEAAETPVVEVELRRSKGWKLIDVTKLVRQVGDGDFHGVALRMASEDCDSEKMFEEGKMCPSFSFVSREGSGEWENRRPVLLTVDPDRPPVEEPVVVKPAPAPKWSMSSDEFAEYIEYLASLPESAIRPAPGAKDRQLKAQQEAGEATSKVVGSFGDPQKEYIGMSLTQIPPYERFVAAYPLSREGVETLSGIVADLYARAEQFEKAERLVRAASQLAKGSEVAYGVEISRAHIEKTAGQVDAAEARLRRLMAAELPQDKDGAWYIRFVAPLQLASLLYEQKSYDAAEQVYVELLDAVEKWNAAHSDDEEVATSYALSAQQGRVNIVLDKNLDDDAGVKGLVEEFERRFPGYADPLRGPAAASLWENVEIRRRMRDQEAAEKAKSAEAAAL